MTNRTDGIADISVRQAAFASGFGLLLMALLAPFADFSVLQRLVVQGDAERTAANLMASGGLFRTGIILLLVVVMLDVVVAWGLYVFFKPVNKSISLLAAWFRLVYAAVFAGALVNLYNALQLLSGARYLSVFESHQVHAQVMVLIDAFRNEWGVGLAIFGIHLLFLGWLVFKGGSRILGILVALASVGYVVDSVGKILAPDYSMNLSRFTFVGEVLLIFWLFWRGRER